MGHLPVAFNTAAGGSQDWPRLWGHRIWGVALSKWLSGTLVRDVMKTLVIRIIAS